MHRLQSSEEGQGKVKMRDMGVGSKEGEDKAPLRSQVNELWII